METFSLGVPEVRIGWNIVPNYNATLGAPAVSVLSRSTDCLVNYADDPNPNILGTLAVVKPVRSTSMINFANKAAMFENKTKQKQIGATNSGTP